MRCGKAVCARAGSCASAATSRSVARGELVKLVPNRRKLTTESSSPRSSLARISTLRSAIHRGHRDRRAPSERDESVGGRAATSSELRIGRASAYEVATVRHGGFWAASGRAAATAMIVTIFRTGYSTHLVHRREDRHFVYRGRALFGSGMSHQDCRL